MKKLHLVCSFLLCGATFLSGCSMMTAQGRRERSYERYVQKSNKGRLKQQRFFASHETTMPVTPMEDPVQSFQPMPSGDISGPQAVGEGQ